MYERFLHCPNLTYGSVLKHILKRKRLTQRFLAESTGILPQRINDYINDRRKISPENSLSIEKALGIEIKGYFYLIQSNHDIFVAEKISSERRQPNLSKIRKSIFWDTDIEKIDWQGNAKFVIQRVFEYGDETAAREIVKFYTPAIIKEQLNLIHSTRLKARRDRLSNLLGL